MNMQAVVLQKYGNAEQALTIREWPKPIPKPHEVLIHSEGFGLNYADVTARKGLYGAAPPPPCILGYELVGTVVETGTDVPINLLGKRVVSFTRFGAYGEFVTAPAKALIEIDEEMPLGDALALTTQYATAWFAFFRSANVQEADRVLIHSAAGGVGQALIQLAILKKCEIVALVGSEEKKEFLKRYPIARTINYRTSNYPDLIRSSIGPRPIDVSFNSAAGRSFKEDLNLLSTGGRLILYGASSRSNIRPVILANLKLVWNMGLLIPIKLMLNSISVSGLNMLKIGDDQPDRLKACMLELMAMYKQGKIKPVLDSEFPVSQVAEAHRRMEEGRSMGKIVVKW
ncbi:MAG: zinc-binding dehydrogenase [Flavobacteriales bacterium]|nr:zinc-binding dehydrogenase [Flavobacteriales bacterium]